jgi:hypothetical protein
MRFQGLSVAAGALQHWKKVAGFDEAAVVSLTHREP